MKNNKVYISLLLAATMILILITACTSNAGGWSEQSGEFSNSEGIDENGFWEGIRALDYVENLNYRAISIPYDVHFVSDYDVQNEIDYILEDRYLSPEKRITDRAVIDGDTVNIDYVGSVDGVEFENGSTGGYGTEVTIGVTSYIDNFLEQLIGHMPGETFNVEVTFPNDYGVDELNGKDAVFVTTINYIVEYELTDDFVSDNLSADYGWTTVAEMEEGLRTDIQKYAMQQYLREILTYEITVKSVPDQITKHQENAMLNYYQTYADMYEMKLEDFLSEYVGADGVSELLEMNRESTLSEATYYLVIQAIAEDAGISVNTEDMVKYLGDDYLSYESQYGLPYLKQFTLNQKVLDHIIENAVLE